MLASPNHRIASRRVACLLGALLVCLPATALAPDAQEAEGTFQS